MKSQLSDERYQLLMVDYNNEVLSYCIEAFSLAGLTRKMPIDFRPFVVKCIDRQRPVVLFIDMLPYAAFVV